MGHLYWAGSADTPSAQDPGYFRELTAMVYGDCGTAAVVTQKAKLSELGATLLTVPDRVKAAGTEWYLVVDGGKTGLGGFRLRAKHADGVTDHWFVDFGRVDAKGPRFLELAPERTGRLQSVLLQGEQPIPAEITTRLCRR